MHGITDDRLPSHSTFLRVKEGAARMEGGCTYAFSRKPLDIRPRWISGHRNRCAAGCIRCARDVHVCAFEGVYKYMMRGSFRASGAKVGMGESLAL